MGNQYIEQAFIELALFPTGHREDVGALVGLGPQFLGASQIERRQRGIEMKIEGRLGSRLTVREAGELFAVAEEKLNGMITNDKFCCTRWDILPLSWWRRPKRLRG